MCLDYKLHGEMTVFTTGNIGSAQWSRREAEEAENDMNDDIYYSGDKYVIVTVSLLLWHEREYCFLGRSAFVFCG